MGRGTGVRSGDGGRGAGAPPRREAPPRGGGHAASRRRRPGGGRGGQPADPATRGGRADELRLRSVALDLPGGGRRSVPRQANRIRPAAGDRGGAPKERWLQPRRAALSTRTVAPSAHETPRAFTGPAAPRPG